MRNAIRDKASVLRTSNGMAKRLARLGVATVLIAGSTIAATPSGPLSTAATTVDDPAATIAPDLQARFDRQSRADLWVRMAANANTRPGAGERQRAQRGQRVVDTLHATANRSQASVHELLEEEGVQFESFWITNAIFVKDASHDLAEQIAEMPGVADIRAPRSYPLIDPVESESNDVTPQAVEWGLNNINAPGAWADGARGEGIVVANIDSGVQFDHPALVRQYRGNNGDGTFTHDYNWYDPSNTCGDPTTAPCDNNGHGTHTMGTMVGDDGAGNQIGVAPDATWMAAKGCEDRGCTDASLAAAAQWLLEPTDLNGQNPDVTKRPDIINNSWGASPPSNDPFFDDLMQAWIDAGIFVVWSNGNDGELGCQSSGAPGSRTIAYSVGAYDINNVIAPFSGRGTGQDGEIKPNIAAPGVNVRSSVPDNGYASIDGTSMAAPHVTGSVALLWSAAPELVGDLAGTRTLLDLTARDTEDLQCGGTAADNNVFGEGRLDAQALVRAGELGLGRISGMVTDAVTGEAISGATVTAAGPITRSVETGPDGTYSLPALAGDYQLTVGPVFGYRDDTAAVSVPKGGTLEHDVALELSARVSVTGVVQDGGAMGGPLHARVRADDGHGHEFTTETDPATGEYALAVVGETGYTLHVTALVPGYDSFELPIDVGQTDTTHDVALPVSPTCTAPGYQPVETGPRQTFDQKPRGWLVHNADLDIPGYLDHRGWAFNNPGDRANNTGADGRFAIVDSDHYGQHHVQDTYLTSPLIDMTAYSTPFVTFHHDLRQAVNSSASVEVSTDGGQSWERVWSKAGFPSVDGPDLQAIHVPQAANKAAVHVRFHYTGQWSGWWQIDDVFLGDRSCEPVN